MKAKNLISIYSINTMNTTVAHIEESIPDIEKMEPEKAVAEIKKVVLANETQLMQQEIDNAELLKISKCRICQRPGELITLMRNRPVYFCKAHNIVNPIPVEIIKKYGFDYTPTQE